MALCRNADLAKGVLSEEAPAGARPGAPGAPGALIGGSLALREHLQSVHAHLGVVNLQRTVGAVTPESSSQLVRVDVMWVFFCTPTCNTKVSVMSTAAIPKSVHRVCESHCLQIAIYCMDKEDAGQHRELTFIFT